MSAIDELLLEGPQPEDPTTSNATNKNSYFKSGNCQNTHWDVDNVFIVSVEPQTKINVYLSKLAKINNK